ncbi:GDP-L-fucose synthase [Rhodococcus olei]|uniref:GDP-L-fucose synthase n=1 Tax=Rhodococcus olei TaxID=2161675 RepID=A0ABP8NUG1_9NOCA
MAAQPISRDARIYIAGHRGLVGAGLWRYFTEHGFVNLIGRSSEDLDLRDSGATAAFLDETRPDVVIDAAARVGGIAANDARPAHFLSDNLRIQLNLLDSAVSAGVRRFLFLGSSCIYPKFAEQPIREEALLGGRLESTNEAYAIAKLAGILQVKAIRSQYGLPYISAMPSNVYGPGDNFTAGDSHVLPAMIRRFHDAVRAGVSEVTCWGTGEPRREFLHVDDLAAACHVLLDRYDDALPINVGTGVDVTIADLARLVADVVGFDGEVRWDATKPDGTPRKLLDVQRLTALGWQAAIPLSAGVKSMYEWFLDHQHDYRR